MPSPSATPQGDAGAAAGVEIVVQPSGISFDVREGESILAAAFRNDVAWPTRCLGKASCRQCFFEIVADAEGVSPVGRLERDALRSVIAQPEPGAVVRLACQTRLQADVTVRKAGVRRATPT